MPFESQAQRGFMYANHPEVAKEFEAATPKGKKLPYKKGKDKKKPAGAAMHAKVKKGLKKAFPET
jgi:hypothetical protein